MRAAATDRIALPLPASLYLRCPHCAFLADRGLPECRSCGLIFSKWARRAPRRDFRADPLPQGNWMFSRAALWICLKSALALAGLVVLAGIWGADDGVSHSPVADRSEGVWTESGGVRLRVNYLRPEGFARLHGDFHGLPKIEYPVYHGGDAVGYEVEIENLRRTPIKGLRVEARQESIASAGGAGRALDVWRALSGAAELRPGATVRLSGKLTVAGPERTGSNFEQTHLALFEEGARGVMRLADAPRAGVLDPPAL